MTRHVSCALALMLLAGPAFANEADVVAVKKVVTRAYIEGIHKDRDPEKIRSGFHPEFVMFVNASEGIRRVSRDQWIARIEDGNRKNPNRPRPKIDYEYPRIEITDDAAMVQVELDRDGKHVFTDYLSLYRTSDGWQIIGKIYQRHP